MKNSIKGGWQQQSYNLGHCLGEGGKPMKGYERKPDEKGANRAEQLLCVPCRYGLTVYQAL